MIRRAAMLTAVAVLGFGTAALSAPQHQPPKHRKPAKHCKRHRHHRKCTPARHKPKPQPGRPTKPNPPANSGTTTTTGVTTSAPATTTSTTTPTPTGPLPSRLEVDENDQGQAPQPYSLWPSHNPVAAGNVQFNVYNFGEDPHTFAIVDSGGHQLAFAHVPRFQPQTAVPVSATLAPGTYTLECTLPGHVGLGMVSTLTVK